MVLVKYPSKSSWWIPWCLSHHFHSAQPELPMSPLGHSLSLQLGALMSHDVGRTPWVAIGLIFTFCCCPRTIRALGTSYVICRANRKIEMWGLWFKNQEFQDSESRASLCRQTYESALLAIPSPLCCSPSLRSKTGKSTRRQSISNGSRVMYSKPVLQKQIFWTSNYWMAKCPNDQFVIFVVVFILSHLAPCPGPAQAPDCTWVHALSFILPWVSGN